MKNLIITLLSLIIFSTFSFTANAQDEKYAIEDVKSITSSCTITKEIKYLEAPEIGFDFSSLKDGVYVIIKWNPVGDGGRCSISLKFEDEEIPINTWSDYNELKLLRLKMSNGHYNYTLQNSMFDFFRLMYCDIENPDFAGYGFSSVLRELD